MDNRSFSISDEYPPRRENGNSATENGRLGYPTHLSQNGGQKNGNLAERFGSYKSKYDSKKGDDEGENTDHMCGAFNRYPKWLQRFADPRWFLLAYCIQNVISGAEGTFLIGSTTSIEKHFQFSSGDMGLIILLSEIGPIITTVLLSFFGGRGNRPWWMAVGLAIGGFGVLLIFSTFLLYPAPALSESGLLDDSKKFCDLQDIINHQFLNSSSSDSGLESASYSVEGEALCGHSKGLAFFLWLVGFTCKALSGTILFTIGAPYLDDSVSKNAAPLYFAISISIRVLGPTIGFSLAAVALNTYVYPGKNYGITPHDPRWIGAWWTGPLAFSCLMLAYSFTLSLFPRKLKGQDSSSTDEEGLTKDGDRIRDGQSADEDLVRTSVVPKDDHPSCRRQNGHTTSGHGVNGNSKWNILEDNLSMAANGHLVSKRSREMNGHNGLNGHATNTRSKGRPTNDRTYGQDVLQNADNSENSNRHTDASPTAEKQQTSTKELIAALKRISKNPVVTFGAMGDLTGMVAEIGMFFWMAKYQEHQFRITKSSSALFSGVSSTASLLLGVIGGGVWIKRFRPTAKTVAYFMTFCAFVYGISLIGLMFVSCDFQEDLPGILSPDAKSVELYRGCSTGCDCNLKEFIPICVEDGPIELTYFSPCHAGCPDNTPKASSISPNPDDDFEIAAPQVFQNCTCGSPSAKVTAGYCQDTCSGIVTYNIIYVLVRSFVSISIIGGTLINMRCVAVDDKPIALGLRTSMISAALIINPLIYGNLIDSACLVWEETCEEDEGSCWLYNTDDFRYKLHGVSAAFIFLCVIFNFIVARKVGNLQLYDEEPTSSSSPSPSSPASSFLFSSGLEGGRKSSLRRSLKKISRLMGRDNGSSRSPGRKKEERQGRKKEMDEKQMEERNDPSEDPGILGQTPKPPNQIVAGNMLPSRIIKTTGV